VLADAQHVTHRVLREMAQRPTRLVAPVPGPMQGPPPKKVGCALLSMQVPQTPDSLHVAVFKQRMQTEGAQEAYRQRKALSEFVHAKLTAMRLDRLPVRGLQKVLCVLLLATTTLNLLQHAPRLRESPAFVPP
jgi:hypothetical protein